MLFTLMNLDEIRKHRCLGNRIRIVNSFDTFQYNDREIYYDGFCATASAKWTHYEEQFATDLQNAHDAGKRMVEKIRGF